MHCIYDKEKRDTDQLGKGGGRPQKQKVADLGCW